MLLALLIPLLLEIQTVSVSWNPQVCGGSCATLLAKRFESHPPIASVKLNAEQGKVVLKWKPNMPFNYEALKRLFQSVGVGFNPFEIKLRGTITTVGKDPYIVSIGDKTRFALIGPAPQSASQYITRGSLALHQLPVEMQNKIARAERDYAMVTVTGDLYMAETPPYKLLIRSFSTDEADQ